MWNDLEKTVKNVEKRRKNRQICQKTGKNRQKYRKIVKNVEKR